MAEYIEKEAALEIAAEQSTNWLYDAINSIPAASVRENVKSKWEDVEITMITEDNAPSEIMSMFCPVCRRYHNEVYHYGNPIENANFCPRCGADMTGGNDG